MKQKHLDLQIRQPKIDETETGICFQNNITTNIGKKTEEKKTGIFHTDFNRNSIQSSQRSLHIRKKRLEGSGKRVFGREF